MIRQVSVERLQQAQDTGYQAFQKRLIPGKENILGVRMPVLRKLAQEIVCGDWRAWLDDPTPDNHDPGHCDCDRSHGAERAVCTHGRLCAAN